MTNPSEQDRELLDALLAASAPDELDSELNDELIARALGQCTIPRVAGGSPPTEPRSLTIDPPPTDDEQWAANALRRALDGEKNVSHDWELVLALRAANSPTDLDEAALCRALSATSATDDTLVTTPSTALTSQRNRWYARALVGSLAVAAAGFLVLRVASAPHLEHDGKDGSPQVADFRQTVAVHAPNQPKMAWSRSTAPLFREPFETTQTTSRIDRIVALRGREMRQNRYLGWRVE
jgi:hypothetical protein